MKAAILRFHWQLCCSIECHWPSMVIFWASKQTWVANIYWTKFDSCQTNPMSWINWLQGTQDVLIFFQPKQGLTQFRELDFFLIVLENWKMTWFWHSSYRNTKMLRKSSKSQEEQLWVTSSTCSWLAYTLWMNSRVSLPWYDLYFIAFLLREVTAA